MFTNILYGAALILLALSAFKDKKKTTAALKKAWKSFENIMPSFLSIIFLIGLILSVLDKELISRLLGTNSGVWGMAIAALIGSITLIPSFVAFPLVAALLKSGAGYGQMAIFVSTLMMVGIVTIPLETKYFLKKTAIKRNTFAFIFSIAVAFVMNIAMK